MYNHYKGSGPPRRVEEPRTAPRTERGAEVPQPQRLAEPRSAPHMGEIRPPSPLSGLSGELGRLFSRLGKISLETEDILLLAVLYLVYRESGDKELLIMMAVLLFL